MRKTLFLGICILLSGCATTYQGMGIAGGYKDVKIQENIFKVTFRGNHSLGPDKTDDFALLRCAEVTLGNGYNYFTVLDEKKENTVHKSGNIQERVISKTIHCFKEKPENTPMLVYDAEQVKTNTKNHYGIK